MAQVTPARKERKRYVVYRPRNDAKVLSCYEELFGTVGMAHAGIMVVDGNDTTSILRVNHRHTDAIKAALVKAHKTTVLTSGTLKTARNALG